MPQLVNVPNVELAREGEEVAAIVGGKLKFTQTDFEELMAAAQDPGLRDGVIRIGHSGMTKLAAETGMPALGYIQNLRIDGRSLRADLVSVPKKLVPMFVGQKGQPPPYRGRSLELQFSKQGKNRTYRMYLSGIALLGETAAAFETLEDVIEYFDVAAAQAPDVPDRENAALVAWFAPEVDPKSAKNDPAGPTVPKDEGDDQEAKAEVELEALAKKLGIDVSADEWTKLDDAGRQTLVDSTLDAKLKAEQPPAEPKPAEEPPPQPKPAEEPPAPTAGLPDNVVPIDKTVLDKLMADAQRGVNADEKLQERDRDEALSAALAQGKITADTKDEWGAMLAKDPEGTKTLLAKMPATVPTSVLGHDGDQPVVTPENLQAFLAGVPPQEEDALYDELFPEEKLKEGAH